MRLPKPLFLPAPSLPPALAKNLPYVLIKPLTRTPFFIQAKILNQALQYIFKEAIADGDFEFLEDHSIQIKITDLNLAWSFTFKQQQIIVNKEINPDASISGKLNEFILLASRREDPDTLFFQRRLVIEGNTEIGLEVKNVMDALDPDNLPTPIKWGLEKIANYVEQNTASN